MITWLSVIFIWLTYHRLFEVWTRFAAFRPVTLCALALVFAWFFSSRKKRPLGNIFTLAIFAYTVALTFSILFSPFTNVLSNITYYAWLVYIFIFVVLMTSIASERELKIIVTSFSVTFFLLMVHSYKGYLSGNAILYDGGVRLCGINVSYRDVNDYSTLLVCAVPMLFPLLALCKKYWHYLFIIGYLLLALRSVQLTGSRTAFIMGCVLFILPAILSRHRFKIFPFVLLAMPLCWYSLDESLKNRFRTIWDSSISPMANATKKGRWDGFYGGLENWSNYPLTGVGMAQHAWGPGGDQVHQAHNLAGQVAGETGTFGIITFLFLLSCFGINHYDIWKNYKYLQEKNLGKEGLYCWRVSFAVMCGILMLLLQGLGLHSGYSFVWPLFGAFQALATMIMQEKVNATIQGKLHPDLRQLRL